MGLKLAGGHLTHEIYFASDKLPLLLNVRLLLNAPVLNVKFLIYIFVGGIQWLIDLLVYSLSWPLFGVAAGQALARSSGAIAGFYLNRQHTFKATDAPGQTGRQALRFLVVWLVNWGTSTILVLWMMQIFGFSGLSAKVIVDVFVVPGNFVLLKMWVFPPSRVYGLNKK